jgi:lactate permease
MNVDSAAVLSVLALLPILIVGLLLVGLRWPARYAMPVGFVVVAAIASLVWRMDAASIAASSVEGLIIAAGLLFIVFGALLLLETLTRSGAMATIRASFVSISPDRRVQAIIIGWLFGSFIEGASGFGTPAAVVAPLLLALGFPAMSAVMVGLIIQSTPVSFGAVGTPVLVGIRGGLADAPAVTARMTELGLDLPAYLQSIGVQVAVLHGAVGFLMPLFLSCMLCGFFGEHRRFADGLHVWRFALFAAFAMIIPYIAVAVVLGPEFPSLLGGLIGLTIVMTASARGFLMPREIWDFPPRAHWNPRWTGSIEPDTRAIAGRRMGIVLAWLPYVIVAGLLVLTRTVTPLTTFLTGLSINVNNIFGTQVSESLQPFYLPGFIFILACLVTYVLHRMSRVDIVESWRVSAGQLVGAAVTLLFALPLVRIFINSGSAFNSSGFDSMPLVLAEGASAIAGSAWPLFAPWIGALGAFVAGSNTVSNLTFSLFQFGTAQNIGVSPETVVAAQAVGGAAGNMITVHNIVAASATAGLLGREGDLIRMTIIPTIYYCLAAGTLAFIAINGVGVNIGTLMALAIASVLLLLARRLMSAPDLPRTDLAARSEAEVTRAAAASRGS